jgi:hypothetical protein
VVRVWHFHLEVLVVSIAILLCLLLLGAIFPDRRLFLVFTLVHVFDVVVLLGHAHAAHHFLNLMFLVFKFY